MSESIAPQSLTSRNSVSGFTLKAASVLCFLVLMAGQWAFFYYIVGFYGTSTFTGNFEIWDRLAVFGRSPYVEGDTFGNLAYASHALAAGIIAFGGALQLIPAIRKYAPTFHRWNGRLFLITVVGLSLSGFYLVWVRKTAPSFEEGVSTTFNGFLILTFAFFALRNAVARNINIHRRWAMRLYLVSNAQWFLRIGFFAYFVLGGIVGHEPGPSDPFLKFWTYGCYLVPLAVLEIYFRAKEHGGPVAKGAVATLLIVLSLAMAAGIFAFSMLTQALITGEPINF